MISHSQDIWRLNIQFDYAASHSLGNRPIYYDNIIIIIIRTCTNNCQDPKIHSIIQSMFLLPTKFKLQCK